MGQLLFSQNVVISKLDSKDSVNSGTCVQKNKYLYFYFMFQRSGFENFCYPKALLPTMDTATWYQRTVAVFSIAIVLLLLVIIFMAVNTIRYGNTFHQYKIVKTVEESQKQFCKEQSHFLNPFLVSLPFLKWQVYNSLNCTRLRGFPLLQNQE